jgi:riboflavin kinase / FMN adenylyltransferase
MAVYTNINNLPIFRKPSITIGTFDGVHMGHRSILQQVVKHAEETDGESILLTFEPHPRKIIFPDQPLKLLTPLDKKIALVQQTGIDHIVVVPFTKEFAALSAQEYIEDFLVKRFNPDTIIIGYDHHFGHDRTGNIELLKQYQSAHQYKVFEISAQLIDEAAVSSTKIRHALQHGKVEEADKMLGRPYDVSGIVSKGAQLGRTIGFPTANVVPTDGDKLIPANGVYAILASRGNSEEACKGMLNIGIRPTVSNDMQLHIEAHLFDFNEDIYGETLELSIIGRLRDEQKFASLDALKEQLHNDKEDAMQLLSI